MHAKTHLLRSRISKNFRGWHPRTPFCVPPNKFILPPYKNVPPLTVNPGDATDDTDDILLELDWLKFNHEMISVTEVFGSKYFTHKIILKYFYNSSLMNM